MTNFIEGKRVAITGGGGSIGSELARRLIERDAQALLLIDNSEVALWRQMMKFEALPVQCRLGDVRDSKRMHWLIEGFKPHVVFHTAALKHVPICERDHDEADRTNRRGTVFVASAAECAKAEVFVLVSPDKETDPVCVLGRTKAAAEEIISDFNSNSDHCRFISVRFHNVFGSSGSACHRFAEQIATGGPVTVTHPDMMRWFATPKEACDLLIACAEHASGPNARDLYALNIGKPMNILELAKSMIGDRNVEIRIVGLRPGERLEEKLVGERERAVDVGIDGIIGIERISDEAVRSTSGVASSEESPAEGHVPEPEVARA